MSKNLSKKAQWVNDNIVNGGLNDFIEYMRGNPESELFQITEDLKEYDPDDLLNQLTKIIDINDPLMDQVHITNVPGHEGNTRYSYGSLFADLSKSKEEVMPDGTKKWVPHFYDKPISEDSFTSVSHVFQGTAFEEIATKLRAKYKLGRFRVMIQPRSNCLSWHSDSQPRLHYPLKTQKGCFMVVNNEMRHMERGKCYLVNTRENHTAVNASRELRVHLVANILK